jgi:hypothetical protein
MYAPVWLGTGLEVEGSRAQLWSVDAVPVLRDPPECLSVQWLPASNASVLVSVTAPMLSPSPEGGQATLNTRPPSALRVNQKRQRSPGTESRRRVTGGTSKGVGLTYSTPLVRAASVLRAHPRRQAALPAQVQEPAPGRRTRADKSRAARLCSLLGAGTVQIKQVLRNVDEAQSLLP